MIIEISSLVDKVLREIPVEFLETTIEDKLLDTFYEFSFFFKYKIDENSKTVEIDEREVNPHLLVSFIVVQTALSIVSGLILSSKIKTSEEYSVDGVSYRYQQSANALNSSYASLKEKRDFFLSELLGLTSPHKVVGLDGASDIIGV